MHGIWNTGSRVGQNIELYPVKRFVFTTPVVVNQIIEEEPYYGGTTRPSQ